MPQIYLKKESYDAIVAKGENVGDYVNRVTEDSLKSVEKRKVK